MRLRLVFFTAVLIMGTFLPGTPLSAQTISFPDAAYEASVLLQRGEELRCFSQRTRTPIAEIAAVNRFVNPAILNDGFLLEIPHTQYRVKTIDFDTALILEAIRAGVPDYTLKALNDTPAFLGGAIAYPAIGNEESVWSSACLPYPLAAITFSLNSVTRGNTMLVTFETVEQTLCEAQYLGHTESCFPLDATHYAVLLGISALDNPGQYTLRIRFTTHHLDSTVDLPFSVNAGYYGYQYINPPVTLKALLDKDVMQAEEDYMQPWRDIRSPYRLWTLPLGFPLTMQLPISADYGDRRSYGGMIDGYHSGVDFRAWTGLPVIAPADGVVIMNERLQARGNAILLDHGWGLITGYWHLSESNVTVGQSVVRGEIIGKVGNTGLSTGSHLHWETWVNGVSVDGKQWYDPQGFGELTQNLSQ